MIRQNGNRQVSAEGSLIHRPRCPAAHCIHCRVHQKHNADGDEASAACAAAHASFSGGILADGIDLLPLYISLNRALAKLRVWLKHSVHRPIPIPKSP